MPPHRTSQVWNVARRPEPIITTLQREREWAKSELTRAAQVPVPDDAEETLGMLVQKICGFLASARAGGHFDCVQEVCLKTALIAARAAAQETEDDSSTSTCETRLREVQDSAAAAVASAAVSAADVSRSAQSKARLREARAAAAAGPDAAPSDLSQRSVNSPGAESVQTIEKKGFAAASSGPTEPIKVIVNFIDGTSAELTADGSQLVAHLRRQMAEEFQKPLTQLVLVNGTTVLHGMQRVAEALDNAESASLTAFLSQDQGPAEEWIADDQMADYLPELYLSLKSQERKVFVDPQYMVRQTEINSRMRSVLIDWLVEVCVRFPLQRKALFLTVSFVDRYLQVESVSRNKLQLCGITALLIAAKFEDINPPSCRDLLYICANAFTQEELMAMEAKMLASLAFDLSLPTAVHFLDIFERTNRCEGEHCHAAEYLVELTLVDMDSVGKPPSELAAAGVLLSNELMRREVCWPAAMASYTGYSEDALRSTVEKMRALHASSIASPYQATRRKFSHPRYGNLQTLLSGN